MTQLKPKEIHIPSQAFCKLGDMKGEKNHIYLQMEVSWNGLNFCLYIF